MIDKKINKSNSLNCNMMSDTRKSNKMHNQIIISNQNDKDSDDDISLKSFEECFYH